MKLVIFGATGGTGKILVDQALALGNEVVAYLRNPSKLNIENEHLEIAQGELDNETLIERAINGADAVISVLGPHARQKGKPITFGMKNILTAMKAQGVRRLIITSTLSAKDPNDSLNFKTKAMIALVKLTMRSAYEDIVSVAETVRASDCDWTIVRVAMLNNNPKSDKVKVGYVGRGEVGTTISRADLADFLLKQVEDTKYVGQAPAISN